MSPVHHHYLFLLQLVSLCTNDWCMEKQGNMGAGSSPTSDSPMVADCIEADW